MNLKFENELRLEYEFNTFQQIILKTKNLEQFGSLKKQVRLYSRTEISFYDLYKNINNLPQNLKTYVYIPTSLEKIDKTYIEDSELISIDGITDLSVMTAAKESFENYQISKIEPWADPDIVTALQYQFATLVTPEKTYCIQYNNTIVAGLAFVVADRITYTEDFVGWVWIEPSIKSDTRNTIRHMLKKIITEKNVRGMHASILCHNTRSLKFFESLKAKIQCVYW